MCVLHGSAYAEPSLMKGTETKPFLNENRGFWGPEKLKFFTLRSEGLDFPLFYFLMTTFAPSKEKNFGTASAEKFAKS